MVVFPNAKINLGLNIVRKREDGYHDLETCFYPLKINDVVEVVKSKEFLFQQTGLTVDGNSTANLCVKAFQLLQKDFPELPNVQMHLHKNIPMGAGLGGGSADGAFVLRLLNEKFNLHLSQQQLIDYALQLGSDCPFFIVNKPCFATSRGEIMQQVEIDLSAYKFLIVNPQIHVSTAWAFANIQPAAPQKSIKQIIAGPVSNWKDELINDFEKPVCLQYPSIQEIKNNMYHAGAVYAAMSGSGSTVFGLFNKKDKPEISFPDNYMVKEITA